MSNPIQASKNLRDLAIAQGCKTDISVVVIKLNIDSNVPLRQATNRKPLKSIVEPEESEDEEEDPKITNIDDVITDSEEEEEAGKSTQGHKDGGKNSAVSRGNAELDQLVLNAVHSPENSPFKPSMESTTFDEEDDLRHNSPSHVAGGASAPSDLTNHVTNEKVMIPMMEYEAQTLPSANKPRKNSHEVPVNGGYAILSETSYEQTQVRIEVYNPVVYVCNLYRDALIWRRVYVPLS